MQIGKPSAGLRTSAFQVMMWRDVVVIVDDGRASAADYDTLRGLESALGSQRELGCLTIIPADSKPPSEDARRAVKAHLAELRPRCFCWCVEGTGLAGATTRAILSGFRLFTLHQYPTQITSSLEDALRWMLPHLQDAAANDAEVHEAVAQIRQQRRAAG